MNKKILLALVLLLTTSVVYAAPSGLEQININDLSRSERAKLGQDSQNQQMNKVQLNLNANYFTNPNLQSGIVKYKKGNFTGCLQELYALTKKDPSNSVAHYYMAMAYTHIGSQADAVESYEKVISLHSNKFLVDYATKGRDCLTGGPACAPEETAPEEQDDLDKFINSPYGNGMSPELNMEVKQKQLQNIKETINNKEQLEKRDIERIKNFDNSKSESLVEDKLASSSVSDEDILKAIKTLKDAGLTVNVQQPGYDMTSQMYAQNPQMAEMSMLLGGNNNNNSNNMMNMVPFMMAQSQSGKNIDPRIMQSMMMNSMMPDFGFGDNNKNRY